jgi:hypothetical protein
MWYRKRIGKDIIPKYLHNLNNFSSYVVCTLFYYSRRFQLEFNICYIIIIIIIMLLLLLLLLLYTTTKSDQYEKNFAEVVGMLEWVL